MQRSTPHEVQRVSNSNPSAFTQSPSIQKCRMLRWLWWKLYQQLAHTGARRLSEFIRSYIESLGWPSASRCLALVRHSRRWWHYRGQSGVLRARRLTTGLFKYKVWTTKHFPSDEMALFHEVYCGLTASVYSHRHLVQHRADLDCCTHVNARTGSYQNKNQKLTYHTVHHDCT